MKIRILTVLLLVLLLPACTISKISGRGTKPLMLNNPTREVASVEPLEVSRMIAFDWTNSFDVSEVAKRKIDESNSDAVANLVVTVRSDFGTFCLNLITIGLANARRVDVTGDLITYRKPAARK